MFGIENDYKNLPKNKVNVAAFETELSPVMQLTPSSYVQNCMPRRMPKDWILMPVSTVPPMPSVANFIAW